MLLGYLHIITKENKYCMTIFTQSDHKRLELSVIQLRSRYTLIRSCSRFILIIIQSITCQMQFILIWEITK